MIYEKNMQSKLPFYSYFRLKLKEIDGLDQDYDDYVNIEGNIFLQH